VIEECAVGRRSCPAGILRLPEELARVDALLDDPGFLAPFSAHYDPVAGRPSIPIDTYLRMMFLKFRWRLGYQTLCREVQDSISWQRFCRIPLGGQVPHPTTLVKLTRRVGPAVVDQLNQTLLAKAATQKVLRTHKVRADTTVVDANVCYPTDTGLLARPSPSWPAPSSGSRPPAAPGAPTPGTGAAQLAAAPTGSPGRCVPAQAKQQVAAHTSELANLA
jgi:IS5 family transposase